MTWDLDDLERRVAFDQQRLPIEEAARKARERGDLTAAASLWQQAHALAVAYGDAISRWYVDGQLADVLIELKREAEAKTVLEASLAAGNDLPFAHSLLVGIYMGQGAVDEACRVQQNAWRTITLRAEKNGMPRIDPSPQIIAFAKWWKTTTEPRPIELAENWARDANAREAWFVVRHERAQWLEKSNQSEAALALYLELVQHGTRHDATYTRALLLLERAKRHAEAMALARSIPALGLSAALEERARKTVARVDASAKPKTSKAPRAKKPVVPAFSIRAGEAAVRWLGQVDVKGGAHAIAARADGLFLTSAGTAPGLWWLAQGSDEPTYIRPIPKRAQLCGGHQLALVSDEGTVKDGSARVELIDRSGATIAALPLPGVTSEIATTSWGLAIGCRAGNLYGLGWDGTLRWRFDVPQTAETSAFGRPCPYFVSSKAATVVFSSFQDVHALREDGKAVWRWRLPPPQEQRIGAFLTMQGPEASISALRATADGGAWVGSQNGDLFRLNARGQTEWAGKAPGNVAQLVVDEQDRLVGTVHSRGVSLVTPNGVLADVVASTSWPKVTRDSQGRFFLAVDRKTMHLIGPMGSLLATLEFSRTIEDAAIVGDSFVVAAGKLATFKVGA